MREKLIKIAVKMAYLSLAVIICGSWAYAGIVYNSLQSGF